MVLKIVFLNICENECNKEHIQNFGMETSCRKSLMKLGK